MAKKGEWPKVSSYDSKNTLWVWEEIQTGNIVSGVATEIEQDLYNLEIGLSCHWSPYS